MQELSATELVKWKHIIIDVLKAFQNICQQHQLTYYAIGGTAIGAVRHHGIIPWDDDIDVGMPRPDFERFLDICRHSDLGDYELVSCETHVDYNLPFPKFCNRNTTLVERSDVPCVIGLFIDVFPLDSTSDDIIEVQTLVERYKKLQNRYEAICTHSTFLQYLALLATPHEWGRFVYKTLGFFCRKPMKRNILQKMHRICHKYAYGETGHLINYGGAYGMRELFDSNVLDGKPVSMPFENITINLMPGYDEYLHVVYGDYMQLPPEGKRIAHHLKAFYDLDKRVNCPFA